jgi:imidazolonepropionase-like amidohydrolase
MTTLKMILVVAGAGMLLSAQSTPPPAPAKVLRFGHLWDGVTLTDSASVVIEGTKITAVETRVTGPANAEMIDLAQYIGIPGLIDLYPHVTYYWDRATGTTPLRQSVSGITPLTPEQLADRAFDNARRTLETGVTTIRDLGASRSVDYMMRDAVNSGQRAGPRMFVAGQGVSAPREGANTTDQRKQVVNTRAESVSDWIRVYGSRGSYDSVDTTQTLTFAEMAPIVDASQALHQPVAIHSYGSSGVHNAVLAGADSVEYGIEIDDATFEEMVKRGTVGVPTIDHNRYYVDAKDEYQFPEDQIPPLRDYIEKNFEATKRAFQRGVTLGMGLTPSQPVLVRTQGSFRGSSKQV